VNTHVKGAIFSLLIIFLLVIGNKVYANIQKSFDISITYTCMNSNVYGVAYLEHRNKFKDLKSVRLIKIYDYSYGVQRSYLCVSITVKDK